ncbi:lipase family protein [Actinomycetes bacterium M1A6_2h]
MKRTAVAQLISGLAVLATVTACTTMPPDTARNSVDITTSYRSPSEPAPSMAGYPKIGGTQPGSLIDVQPFDSVEPRIVETGARAYRIKYLSTPAVGTGTVEVTGAVYVPGGTAPDGGWRVVSYNHGNTGISPECGPSLYDDLKGQWSPIASLLLNNYLVVAPDYEGLNGPGGSGLRHAFLDGASLGRNVVDGVRAAMDMRPDIGKKWAAYGGSLGGLATWAANEQASTYGQGMDLVGAASWVPVVNVSELPAKAAQGKLTREQQHLYFLAIMGLKATLHPELDLSDYIRGSMYENRNLLVQCTGPKVQLAIAVLESVSPTDLIPVDAAAQQRMQGWLEELAVPKQKTAAPMIVVYGTNDTLVDQPWIETALDEACAKGDSISWFLRPGEGHGDIDASQTLPWMNSRFDGGAPENMCNKAGAE